MSFQAMNVLAEFALFIYMKLEKGTIISHYKTQSPGGD
jgi:hypothetical protein